jgi:hypothetical protein
VFTDLNVLGAVFVEKLTGGFGSGLGTGDEFSGAKFEGGLMFVRRILGDGNGDDEEDDENA